MIKPEWPHTTKQIKTPCVVCSKDVYQNKSPHNLNKWSPESKYWNLKQKEIYCGVDCSFKRHEERRNFE